MQRKLVCVANQIYLPRGTTPLFRPDQNKPFHCNNLGTIAGPNRGEQRAIGRDVAVCHAGVEGEAGIVLAVEENEAAGGTGALAEEMDDFTERREGERTSLRHWTPFGGAQGRPRAWRQAETAW